MPFYSIYSNPEGIRLSFTSKRPTIFISSMASIISIAFQCTTKQSPAESTGIHCSPWDSAGVHWSPPESAGLCQTMWGSVKYCYDSFTYPSPLIFLVYFLHAPASCLLFLVYILVSFYRLSFLSCAALLFMRSLMHSPAQSAY